MEVKKMLYTFGSDGEFFKGKTLWGCKQTSDTERHERFWAGSLLNAIRRAGGKFLNTVYIIDGPYKGTSFDLNDGITTIGRSTDNDICISDRGVSRHHGKFLKKDGGLFIVDLNSLHGVFVDGEKIYPGQEVPLTEESTVLIRKTLFSFQKKLSPEKANQTHPIYVQRKLFDTATPLLVKDSTRSYVRNLELLLKVSNIFAQSLNIDELLGEVIDQIFSHLKRIDRGAILLLDQEAGILKEAVSKTRMEDKEGLLSKINYSRTILTELYSKVSL
jgi:pSer/pThr/pTyr-binding forkhead associated (FHA) protein